MGSPEFDRVMFELTTHPKEREGFRKSDLETLQGSEKTQVLRELFDRLENGQNLYEEPLQWLLGDRYREVLSDRLAALPPDAHGQIFLPFFLFKSTGDRHYLDRMMHAIISGETDWDGRRFALGRDLREIIGQEPIFWDFCHYLVLHDKSLKMKERAMTWLARCTNHLTIDDCLTSELVDCVHRLHATHGRDPKALAVLDRLHLDTGRIKP